MKRDGLYIEAVPMAGALCAVIVGNVVARLGVGKEIGVLLLGCGVAWLVAMAILSARKNSSVRIMMLSNRRDWLIPLFAGAAIITSSGFSKSFDVSSLPKGECVITGEIASAEQYSGGISAIINVREIVDSAGIIRDYDSFAVMAFCGDCTLREGEVVRMNSELRPMDSHFHKEPNLVAAATPRSVTVTAMARSPRRVALEIRNEMSDFIGETRLQPVTQSFLQAVLLADKSRISASEREKFANAGLAHILAVSGLHVGIVAGMLLFLTLPLTLVRMRNLRWMITVGALWGYAFICGLEVPVVRAAVMFTFLIAARGSGRPYMSLNALLGAAAFIIIADPGSVIETGFQLSFMVTFAIITFPRLWRERIQRIGNPVLRVITEGIAFSFVAWLAGWMLSAVYFHSAPLLSVPVNIVILPFLPIIFAISVVYLFLAAFGIDIHLLAIVIDGSVSAINGVTVWASGMEWSRVFINIHPVIPWLWYISIVMAGIWVWYRRNAWLGASAATMAATLAASLML